MVVATLMHTTSGFVFRWGGRFNFRCGDVVVTLGNGHHKDRFAFEQQLAQASQGLCPEPLGCGTLLLDNDHNLWRNGTFTETGYYVIGASMAWQLSTFVPSTGGDEWAARGNHQQLLDLAADALTRFWEISPGPSEYVEPLVELPTSIQDWETRVWGVASRGHLSSVMAQAAIDWVVAHPEVVVPTPQRCVHRDFNTHNLLVAGNRVVIVDLERAGMGQAHDELVALVAASVADGHIGELDGGWWGRGLCQRLPALRADSRKWRFAAMVRFVHLFDVQRFWGPVREDAFLQLASTRPR